MKEKNDISEWPYDKNQVSVLHELRFNEQKTIVKFIKGFIESIDGNSIVSEKNIKISPSSLLFLYYVNLSRTILTLINLIITFFLKNATIFLKNKLFVNLP